MNQITQYILIKGYKIFVKKMSCKPRLNSDQNRLCSNEQARTGKSGSLFLRDVNNWNKDGLIAGFATSMTSGKSQELSKFNFIIQ